MVNVEQEWIWACRPALWLHVAFVCIRLHDGYYICVVLGHANMKLEPCLLQLTNNDSYFKYQHSFSCYRSIYNFAVLQAFYCHILQRSSFCYMDHAHFFHILEYLINTILLKTIFVGHNSYIHFVWLQQCSSYCTVSDCRDFITPNCIRNDLRRFRSPTFSCGAYPHIPLYIWHTCMCTPPSNQYVTHYFNNLRTSLYTVPVSLVLGIVTSLYIY